MGRAAAAACLGVFVSLLVAVPAVAAGPKPDPPPIRHAPPPPPPPVAPQPPPPAAQPALPPPPAQPAPPPPVAVAPAAPVHRAAVKHRALRARRKANRAADGVVKVREQPPPLVAGAAGSGSSSLALPFLLVAFTAAIVMLVLALTPARAVPWSRASHALEDHRDELGVIGGLCLVATMVFFLLVQVTK